MRPHLIYYDPLLLAQEGRPSWSWSACQNLRHQFVHWWEWFCYWFCSKSFPYQSTSSNFVCLRNLSTAIDDLIVEFDSPLDKTSPNIFFLYEVVLNRRLKRCADVSASSLQNLQVSSVIIFRSLWCNLSFQRSVRRLVRILSLFLHRFTLKLFYLS